MSMLLLVRNADDMRRAVESTNAFSAYRRERFGEQVSQVIGVWLRRELDAGLPSFSCADLVSDGVGPVKGADRISESNPRTSATELKIRESFSLSGVWTICWVNGVLGHDAQSPAEQRRAIIDTIVSPYSRADCRFFPVFQQGESMEHIQNAMRELREQHSELIAATWFIDDSERGLIAAKVEPDPLN